MTPRRRTSLTAQKAATIKEVALKNNSSAVISRAIDINKNTVAYVAKSVRSGAGVAKVDGQGRPLLRSPKDIRALPRIGKVNRFSSVEDIKRRVIAPRTSALSTRTVLRATHNLCFMSTTSATKPWVSDANKVKRVAWAKERRSWDNEWSSVFFTDQSSFEFRRPGRARVWRSVGKRLQPSCLRPSYKSGRQTLMVWAGFSARGRTRLRRVCGCLNTEQYKDVLANGTMAVALPYSAWKSRMENAKKEDAANSAATKRIDNAVVRAENCIRVVLWMRFVVPAVFQGLPARDVTQADAAMPLHGLMEDVYAAIAVLAEEIDAPLDSLLN